MLQATTERSHYYVAATVKEAIAEIERLRVLDGALATLAEGLSARNAKISQ